MAGLERWRLSQPLRGVQAGIADDNLAGRAFLHAYGFESIMLTRNGTLDPKTLTDAWWSDTAVATAAAEERGIRLAPCDDDHVLVRTHEAVYREQHGWNPVGPLTEGESRSIFLSSLRMIPIVTVIIWRDDQPIGVGSLNALTEPGDVFLTWLGTVSMADPDHGLAVRATIGWCLDHARQHDRPIAIEADRYDLELWEALTVLPATWNPDWHNLDTKDLVSESVLRNGPMIR